MHVHSFLRHESVFSNAPFRTASIDSFTGRAALLQDFELTTVHYRVPGGSLRGWRPSAQLSTHGGRIARQQSLIARTRLPLISIQAGCLQTERKHPVQAAMRSDSPTAKPPQSLCDPSTEEQVGASLGLDTGARDDIHLHTHSRRDLPL